MEQRDRPVDKRIVRSKQALKSALLALMEKKAFSAITATEIVRLANFNRGTFYAHYEHKEALLEDIIRDLMDGLIESFRKPYKDTDSFRIDEFPASAVELFDHIHANRSVYALMVDQQVLPGIREKMFRTLKSTIEDELVYMSGDAAEGLDVELFVIYQMHALLGLTFHWIQDGFKQSPAYMAEQLVLILRTHPNMVKTKLPKGRRGTSP